MPRPMRMPERRRRIAAASLAATHERTHRRRRPTRANAGSLRVPHTACRARRAFWIAGNGKGERGAGPVIRFTPQTTTMLFDDGTADGQSDAHTTALCGEEGLKELVHDVGLQANADIPHRQAHTVAFVTFGSDEELPRTIVHADHRVSSIAEQVQDDLLKLDTIGGDERKIVGELRSEHEAVYLKLVHRRRKHR